METVERPKAWPDIADRKSAVVAAVGMSLAYAVLTLLSETFHLTQRSTYFVADLDGAWWRAVAAYTGFAIVSGAAVGAIVARDRVWQSFALGALYFTCISLKVLWLDTHLLGVPRVAAVFAVFVIGFFGTAIVLASRLRLGPVFPLLLVIGYVNVTLGIASGWAMFGGRLMAFLLSPRTLAIVAGGVLLVPALTLAQHLLERRNGWRRLAVPGLLAAVLVIATAAISRRIPARDDDSQHEARGGAPDIYILSFDALRSDDLSGYITRHPQGNIARLAAQATTFENVVSHGSSTDIILANHTLAGNKTTCDESLPREVARAGYFSAMIYGGVGRRFAGSVCYDFYFAGDAEARLSRFALPALTSRGEASLRYRNLAASKLLQKLERVAENPVPLQAYLHFLELHVPYLPEGRRGDASYIEDLERYMQGCYAVACDPDANRALIERVRSAYLETFDEVDRVVGRAREIVEARRRPYVMVVTADHGELFGEHGGFAHSGGLVPELLDIPYIVFDSRVPTHSKRCELMLSSEAIRATVIGAVESTSRYPDHAVLEWEMKPLGTGRIDKQQGLLQYVISPEVYEHAGTWRNIHRERNGTLRYPIASCE